MENRTRVFERPNFTDPTLYQRRSEVIGFYNQKWKTGDFGDFDPQYHILPQVSFILYLVHVRQTNDIISVYRNMINWDKLMIFSQNNSYIWKIDS